MGNRKRITTSAMQLVWTHKAIKDLIAIRRYIAQNNPLAAANVAATINSHVQYLQSFPDMGMRLKDETTRRLVIPRFPYFVIYVLSVSNIEILSVYHTAQQWPEKL
ncbi:MAG: type II toxin-antitoxin system RelE/ParE family toxin [Magnetococcales bacterium]|nr:type II toxin-antitoxin system RelE/ParE family toxin [Magnetococcales bacterium]